MTTYLLTWNPKKWEWKTLESESELTRKQGFLDRRWSCGQTKRIRAGDRIFLLRQGLEPRGIVASGSVISEEPFEKDHYTEAGRKALYIYIRWNVLLNSDQEPILSLEYLNSGSLAGKIRWQTQVGGITIEEEAAEELEKRWYTFLSDRGIASIRLPEEVPAAEGFWEGALRRITVNAYERDPQARQACIDHFGPSCQICEFDFGALYGKHGAGFIHVHHIRPLSEISKGYAVNPKQDLIPVCPNCHAMLHKTTPPLTVKKLQELMQSASKLL